MRVSKAKFASYLIYFQFWTEGIAGRTDLSKFLPGLIYQRRLLFLNISWVHQKALPLDNLFLGINSSNLLFPHSWCSSVQLTPTLSPPPLALYSPICPSHAPSRTVDQPAPSSQKALLHWQVCVFPIKQRKIKVVSKWPSKYAFRIPWTNIHRYSRPQSLGLLSLVDFYLSVHQIPSCVFHLSSIVLKDSSFPYSLAQGRIHSLHVETLHEKPSGIMHSFILIKTYIKYLPWATFFHCIMGKSIYQMLIFCFKELRV